MPAANGQQGDLWCRVRGLLGFPACSHVQTGCVDTIWALHCHGAGVKQQPHTQVTGREAPSLSTTISSCDGLFLQPLKSAATLVCVSQPCSHPQHELHVPGM